MNTQAEQTESHGPLSSPAFEPLRRAREGRGRRLAKALSFKNIGALYVFIAICIVFSVWVPSTFATVTTLKQVLNENAATGLMALSIIIPLCTRTFDLSV